MNSPAKPKSNLATTEDFAPPLIMFLRTKSNRSSRSRSNPKLIRKINAETNPEPSSPKVTCIGQVRVKRSKNKQTITACKWIGQLKPRWFRRVWVGEMKFFTCDCCIKPEEVQEPDVNRVKHEMGGVIGTRDGELVSESPPRNAILLTRSKSAPHRYSL